MKVVYIEVLPVAEGDVVQAVVLVEKRKGESWNRMKSWDVVSGMPEAKRRIILEDDERVVIEGSATHTLVFDKEQNAAVRKELPPNPVEVKKGVVDTRPSANPSPTQPGTTTASPAKPTASPHPAVGGAASSKDIKAGEK